MAQVAAALALGAAGVVLGTRLNCTIESAYPEHGKQAYLGASDAWQGKDGSRRTTLWDQAFLMPGGGTVNWPQGIDGRALENSITKKFLGTPTDSGEATFTVSHVIYNAEPLKGQTGTGVMVCYNPADVDLG